MKNNIQEKKLRDIINQELRKSSIVKETDLIAPDGNSWVTMKDDLKQRLNRLLSNLESDDYDDALGDISGVVKILKHWKKRIDKGLVDETQVSENNAD